MKLNLSSTAPIGQSNTDYRRLSAAQLVEHIELLQAKRPHNWTPTYANLRAACGRLDGLIGRAFGHVHGGRLVRTGTPVLIEVKSSDPFGEGPAGTAIYDGIAVSVDSRGIVVCSESSHGGGRGRVFLRHDEILALATC